jgi:putative transposase
MARPLRIHFPGAIYHVCSRMPGSWRYERNQLFQDDNDRENFLGRLQQSVQDFEVRLFLYCLMSNHFHLLMETPRGNLSKFMQSLNTGCTVYYSRRHQRHGHLLDGRYKAELVAGDEYLLKLSRYIHLNPVSTSSDQ